MYQVARARVVLLTISEMQMEEPGIYTDLVRQFLRRGHEVYVVCTGAETSYVVTGRLHMLRVAASAVRGAGTVRKGLATLLLAGRYQQVLRRYVPNVSFDMILYTTPPVTLAPVIAYLKRRGGRSYLLLKDIFPQNAVDLQMLRKGMLYRYFRFCEKQLYETADVIGVMSPANARYVLQQAPHKHVELCPNSIELREVKRNVAERRRYGIPDGKVVLLYGGNLGKPQGLAFLCECLQFYRAHPTVFFVIVGGGTEWQQLAQFLQRTPFENVLLLAEMDALSYEKLAAACDVGLLFLDPRFTVPNIPSRLLAYMQASLPVLAATDEATDVGTILAEGAFGYGVQSGDIVAFHAAIEQLLQEDVRREMGHNARAYLKAHWTVQHTYDTIMQHMG